MKKKEVFYGRVPDPRSFRFKQVFRYEIQYFSIFLSFEEFQNLLCTRKRFLKIINYLNRIM